MDASSYKHDALGWAPDREMLTLYGVQNYPQGEVAAGTGELSRIRLGYHPGDELRLVFDLADTSVGIRDIQSSGTSLILLIQ